MRILSLYDRSGNICMPWANNGIECITVDILSQTHNHPLIHHICSDTREYYNLVDKSFDVIFAFPPCTHLASSGARWWKKKDNENPNLLKEALELAKLPLQFMSKCNAHTVIIENPVGRLSTLWRKPDYNYQPYEYRQYCQSDNYSKDTCLWVYGQFIMPKKIDSQNTDTNRKRIHHMSSSVRGEKGSITPIGFSLAVYEANHAVWMAL